MPRFKRDKLLYGYLSGEGLGLEPAALLNPRDFGSPSPAQLDDILSRMVSAKFLFSSKLSGFFSLRALRSLLRKDLDEFSTR
jgi:hypothetical protein